MPDCCTLCFYSTERFDFSLPKFRPRVPFAPFLIVRVALEGTDRDENWKNCAEWIYYAVTVRLPTPSLGSVEMQSGMDYLQHSKIAYRRLLSKAMLDGNCEIFVKPPKMVQSFDFIWWDYTRPLQHGYLILINKLCGASLSKISWESRDAVPTPNQISQLMKAVFYDGPKSITTQTDIKTKDSAFQVSVDTIPRLRFLRPSVLAAKRLSKIGAFSFSDAEAQVLQRDVSNDKALDSNMLSCTMTDRLVHDIANRSVNISILKEYRSKFNTIVINGSQVESITKTFRVANLSDKHLQNIRLRLFRKSPNAIYDPTFKIDFDMQAGEFLKLVVGLKVPRGHREAAFASYVIESSSGEVLSPYLQVCITPSQKTHSNPLASHRFLAQLSSAIVRSKALEVFLEPSKLCKSLPAAVNGECRDSIKPKMSGHQLPKQNIHIPKKCVERHEFIVRALRESVSCLEALRESMDKQGLSECPTSISKDCFINKQFGRECSDDYLKLTDVMHSVLVAVFCSLMQTKALFGMLKEIPDESEVPQKTSSATSPDNFDDLKLMIHALKNSLPQRACEVVQWFDSVSANDCLNLSEKLRAELPPVAEAKSDEEQQRTALAADVAIAGLKELIDSALTDSVSTAIGVAENNLLDSANLSDSVSTAIGVHDDAVLANAALTDSVSTAIGVAENNLLDSANLTDSVSTAIDVAEDMLKDASLHDSVSTAVGVLNTATLTDSVSTAVGVDESTDDSVPTEQATVSLDFSGVLPEQLNKILTEGLHRMEAKVRASFRAYNRTHRIEDVDRVISADFTAGNFEAEVEAILSDCANMTQASLATAETTAVIDRHLTDTESEITRALNTLKFTADFEEALNAKPTPAPQPIVDPEIIRNAEIDSAIKQAIVEAELKLPVRAAASAQIIVEEVADDVDSNATEPTDDDSNVYDVHPGWQQFGKISFKSFTDRSSEAKTVSDKYTTTVDFGESQDDNDFCKIYVESDPDISAASDDDDDDSNTTEPTDDDSDVYDVHPGWQQFGKISFKPFTDRSSEAKTVSDKYSTTADFGESQDSGEICVESDPDINAPSDDDDDDSNATEPTDDNPDKNAASENGDDDTPSSSASSIYLDYDATENLSDDSDFEVIDRL